MLFCHIVRGTKTVPVSVWGKKQKCHSKCEGNQWHTLVPFVVSIDGMLAPEAVNTSQHIAQLLCENGDIPDMRPLVMSSHEWVLMLSEQPTSASDAPT